MIYPLKPKQLITSKTLRDIGACDTHIRKFRKEWPDGVKLLKKNLLRAAEIKLDVDWLAMRILQDKQRELYYLLIKDKNGAVINVKRGRYNAFYVPALKQCARALWKALNS